MIYYYKDNKVYSSNIKLSDDSFTEITKEEYDERMVTALESKEQGKPIDEFGDEWFTEEVTEADYINALESLEVTACST